MLLAFDGSVLVANAGRLGVLALPVALGMLTVRARLIKDPTAAVAALNVYTLYVGFPALIAAGVANVDLAVASDWGLWLVVPVLDLLLLLACRSAGAVLPGRQAGSMALVCLFGNTAYLGIPFVVSVLGESARGPAALLVAVQVGLAVAVGPLLLTRWSGDHTAGVAWSRLLRQPLLWAPLAGAVVRAIPQGGRDVVLDAIGPLAASTAPVAMFLLGLYLFQNRDLVRVAEAGVWSHVGLRMVVAPALSLGLALLAVEVGAFGRPVAAIVVMLGGMPAAITTFSLAEHEGVAADRVASVVVRSSVVALVTLPLLATLAEWVARV